MYMRSNVRPSWKTIQPIVKKNTWNEATGKLGQHMRSQSTAFISFAPNIWTVSRDALSLEIYEGEQNKMRNTPSIDWLINGHVLLLSKRPWSDFLYWVNSFWFVLKYNKRLITWNITHKVLMYVWHYAGEKNCKAIVGCTTIVGSASLIWWQRFVWGLFAWVHCQEENNTLMEERSLDVCGWWLV